MIARARMALKALLCASMLFCMCANVGCIQTSSNQLCQIAASELKSYGDDAGEKYWKWMGYDSHVAWCACFVSYCADRAGLIDSKAVPKSASVDEYVAYYTQNPSCGTLLSAHLQTTQPQAGDLAIFDVKTDEAAAIDSHIGIVVEVSQDASQVKLIEGNCADAVCSNWYPVHDAASYYVRLAGASSSLVSCTALTSSYTSGSLSSGQTVELPDGCGGVMTYMAWDMTTATSSAQYRLRVESGEHYDAEGFGTINGRYVIACTSTFGSVGDYVDFTLSDGRLISCVIGDIKSSLDEGCNMWGHQSGACVIEFCVEHATWYNGHANPGTATCHPEWAQGVASASNLGSWFDDRTLGASEGAGSSSAYLSPTSSLSSLLGLFGCSSLSASSTGGGARTGIAGLIWPSDTSSYSLYSTGDDRAVDISCAEGSGVYSAAAGTVVYVQTGYGNAQGSTGMASYGNMVAIYHPALQLTTVYAHLQSVSVQKGQSVLSGQRIGASGNTGNSYGAHLHFEIWEDAGAAYGIGTRISQYSFGRYFLM